MNESGVQTYCLFCISGRESAVSDRLKAAGYVSVAPQVICWKPAAGGVRKVLRPLLPGYVFFDSDTVPDWLSIQRNRDVLRILHYDDGERALRGSDAAFVHWLKKYDGIIETSHAIQVGTKLEFVDGPLKDMSGRVVKVNKNRRQVQVALGDEASMLRTVWCSMEFLEVNTEGSAMPPAEP